MVVCGCGVVLVWLRHGAGHRSGYGSGVDLDTDLYMDLDMNMGMYMNMDLTPKRAPQGAAKHNSVVATTLLLTSEDSDMGPPMFLQIKPPGPARPPKRATQGAAKHHGMVATPPFGPLRRARWAHPYACR